MRHTRVIVAHYGGPEELRVVEEECPEPKHGEVRVKVLTAGVSLGGDLRPYLLLRGGRLASGRPARRNRFHGIPMYLKCIVGGWLLPGRKRMVLYSIQWLKRMRPALFRQDLTALLDLLREHKIRPLIAQRFLLVQARQAQELLGQGGVTGKIVLVLDGSGSRAA